MQDLIQMMRGLVAHWIEHNNEHADKFLEWAARAEAAGLKGVSERLSKASSLLKEASKELEAVSRELESIGLV